MQRVSGFQGELAFDLQHGNGSGDRIHVHQSDGAGCGCHALHQFLIGIDHNDGWMICPAVVGGGDQVVNLIFRKRIDFFQRQFHLRCGGVASEEGDGLALRPVIGLAFSDLDQIGHADVSDAVGFVGDERQVSGQRHHVHTRNH